MTVAKNDPSNGFMKERVRINRFKLLKIEFELMNSSRLMFSFIKLDIYDR